MLFTREGWPTVSIGSLIALLILIAVFVLYIVGQMDGRGALLFGGLSLAILLR